MGFSKRLNTFFMFFFSESFLKIGPPQVHPVTCQSRIKRLSSCDSTKLLLEVLRTPGPRGVFFLLDEKHLESKENSQGTQRRMFPNKETGNHPARKDVASKTACLRNELFWFLQNKAYIIYCRNESNRFVLASKYVN